MKSSILEHIDQLNKYKIFNSEKTLALIVAQTKTSPTLCPLFEDKEKREVLYSHGFLFGAQPLTLRGLYQYDLSEFDSGKKGMHSAQFPSISAEVGSLVYILQEKIPIPVGMMADYAIIEGKAQKVFVDATSLKMYLQKELPKEERK